MAAAGFAGRGLPASMVHLEGGNVRPTVRRFALASILALSGCSSEIPTAVPPAAAPATNALPLVRASGQRLSDPSAIHTETIRFHATAADLQPPVAVFKVQPAPENGVIIGTSPFDVTFNVCRSENLDGNRLLFTMDADGDGILDELGTHGGNCRRTFTYTAGEGEFRGSLAEICVVDLDAAGARLHTPECRRYDIRIYGPPSTTVAGSTLCAKPKVGVPSQWNATGTAGVGQTCTCQLDGVVVPFSSGSGNYEVQCTVPGPPTGGLFAAWGSVTPGQCTCHS